ncbi:MAG: sodium:proton antiporter NhaD [Flavobacteriales bacterium]|jgi:Na+/H+ antiporter NhaD/arsenite permease-like protein
MTVYILFIFIVGYVFISTEHWHRIDKMIPAILMMVLSWGLLFVFPNYIPQWLDPNSAELLISKLGFVPDLVGNTSEKTALINEALQHHLSKTAEIVVFLIGAMTLVELIDHFNGFDAVQGFFKAKKKWNLLVLLCTFAFFLSAVIDNLTATLVMIAIYRKIITDPTDRLWFAGFIVIAANAGGAWSPIGDVTTTMLWIGHKVSTTPLIINTFIPSVLSIGFPLLVARFIPAFKGEILLTEKPENTNGKIEFILGVLLFLSVPLLKSILHIPPYMGMLLALCLFALYAEIKTKRNFTLTEVTSDFTPQSPTMKSLKKVELPTILFFLGILLTVAALESIGFIFNLGQSVQNAGISTPLFMGILGLASAVIDNVPLVAGAMGMFSYPIDHATWHLLAYTAGTGGSILIIGSAAGVVAMGLEKISFSWYLKNIAPLALLGYLIGFIFMWISL